MNRSPHDGHSMQLWSSPQAAGQDQKYFPQGTSKAVPVPELTDEQRLENGLTELLGSREAARAYMSQSLTSSGQRIAADRYGVAALIIRTVDQQAVHPISRICWKMIFRSRAIPNDSTSRARREAAADRNQ